MQVFIVISVFFLFFLIRFVTMTLVGRTKKYTHHVVWNKQQLHGMWNSSEWLYKFWVLFCECRANDMALNQKWEKKMFRSGVSWQGWLRAKWHKTMARHKSQSNNPSAECVKHIKMVFSLMSYVQCQLFNSGQSSALTFSLRHLASGMYCWIYSTTKIRLFLP
jgi:hypothetical protein